MSRYAFCVADRMICSWSERGLDKLGLLDLPQKTLTPLDLEIARNLSRPQPVEFLTTGGKAAFGLFYPPANPDFVGPPGEFDPSAASH